MAELARFLTGIRTDRWRNFRSISAVVAAMWLAGTIWLAGTVDRGSAAELVPETVALRHGLTRAWFAQLDMTQNSDTLAYTTLQHGMLYAQTTGAMIHALDAETGRTAWAEPVGSRDRYSVAPGANDKNVAVVNGSVLYVLDRTTGRMEWSLKLRGSPARARY